MWTRFQIQEENICCHNWETYDATLHPSDRQHWDWFQKSEVALTQSGFNFSSIIYECDGCNIGYGYPNPKYRLSNSQLNPLYKNRNDGYIFIHNEEYSEVELLVFPDKKDLIDSIYNHIIDGHYDEQLEYIQVGAKVFYDYNSTE